MSWHNHDTDEFNRRFGFDDPKKKEDLEKERNKRLIDNISKDFENIKSLSDQFRERLERMQFEDYCHIDPAYEKRLKKHIMDRYNEVHK